MDSNKEIPRRRYLLIFVIKIHFILITAISSLTYMVKVWDISGDAVIFHLVELNLGSL